MVGVGWMAAERVSWELELGELGSRQAGTDHCRCWGVEWRRRHWRQYRAALLGR